MESLLSSNKKGQVQNIAPAMLSLIFAAVVLVFGLVIIQEMRDFNTLKNSATTTNETGAYINTTNYTLSNEQGEKTNRFVITAIWGDENQTNGTQSGIQKIPSGYTILIPAANYTVGSSNGVLGNISVITNPNVSVSYTYYTGDEAWDSSNKTVVGLGTFADFWEIIVLAIIIAVVIGLLLSVFGRSRSR